MPSPIIARADALMQRKRQSSVDLDDIPILTDTVEADDIPVLTEIAMPSPPERIASMVDASAPADIEMPPEAPASPATLDSALRDHLVRELARRVEQRLGAELPRLIESTVRDFLAEQEMIASLPQHD